MKAILEGTVPLKDGYIIECRLKALIESTALLETAAQMKAADNAGRG
jgi:hypothetical protein